MAFCTNCGKPVVDNDVFCGGCGTRQAEAAAGPATGPAPGSAGFGSAGAPAPGAAPTPGFNAQAPFAAVETLSPQTAATLCYVPWIGWVMSLVVLSSERFRREARTRFHAFQGLYLWVAYLIVEWVVKPMFRFGHWGGFPPVRLLEIAILVGWIYMLIKTHKGETVKLPIIGDLAEKSVAEQG